MVTANRAALARRSIACFLAQDYPNRELVVIDDGQEDYGPWLAPIPADRLIYHRVAKDPSRTLGDLRNLSLDIARGAVIAQWDDDDWFDPERLSYQMAILLRSGARSCWTEATLMHLDSPDWIDRPYVGYFKGGAPSTILHHAGPIRYPATRKGEDSVYRDAWRKDGFVLLPREAAWLLLRCFHGANTWDRRHFSRRVAIRPVDIAEWTLRRWLGRTAGYSLFQLSERQWRTFREFDAASRALGLIGAGRADAPAG